MYILLEKKKRHLAGKYKISLKWKSNIHLRARTARPPLNSILKHTNSVHCLTNLHLTCSLILFSHLDLSSKWPSLYIYSSVGLYTNLIRICCTSLPFFVDHPNLCLKIQIMDVHVTYFLYAPVIPLFRSIFYPHPLSNVHKFFLPYKGGNTVEDFSPGMSGTWPVPDNDISRVHIS
jgi:hypothetical protein